MMQRDLFDRDRAPAAQRGGIPRHVPTAESRLLVNELRAAGQTQVAIAEALGISPSTFAIHYLDSSLSSPRRGRRRHAPTSATRKIVRRAMEGGMKQAEAAKLLGISLPTLRLNYPEELGSNSTAAERRARRDQAKQQEES